MNELVKLLLREIGDSFCGRRIVPTEPVCVYLHRYLRVGMAQPGGYLRDRSARLDKHGRVEVPELVWCDLDLCCSAGRSPEASREPASSRVAASGRAQVAVEVFCT